MGNNFVISFLFFVWSLVQTIFLLLFQGLREFFPPPTAPIKGGEQEREDENWLVMSSSVAAEMLALTLALAFENANTDCRTPGSTGLDLQVREWVALVGGDNLTKIPTGIWGPLPTGHMGLILGKSHLNLQGITVVPGVVDFDCEGEIQIAVVMSQDIWVFELGEYVAQLLLIPCKLHPSSRKEK
ncbi:deoxyuridine 5'-triphosphate nucleotidohydrolase-like [Symphalangus syndactylus]|uniref:deoxyuridine 5'-triphosphate nucleotidohydrolase-like n=1 Tax=Symphalangus syndactylus TaxID=9590 RepID=UPI002441A945|nr:deoxyuridine 5'-triphosphate nucleotidohydrolase-like [Symphalangus syndactylus]